jgi:hypothetical protein
MGLRGFCEQADNSRSVNPISFGATTIDSSKRQATFSVAKIFSVTTGNVQRHDKLRQLPAS